MFYAVPHRWCHKGCRREGFRNGVRTVIRTSQRTGPTPKWSRSMTAVPPVSMAIARRCARCVLWKARSQTLPTEWSFSAGQA